MRGVHYETDEAAFPHDVYKVRQYLEYAQDQRRAPKHRSALAQLAPRQSRTLAEELAALRRYMAEQDANPFTHLPKRLHLYDEKGVSYYTRS